MKRFIKVLSVVLAAMIFVCGIPVSAASASGIDRARNGVVFITSELGSGSGFAIGSDLDGPVQYIVTAGHMVIDDESGYRCSEVTVWFSAMANEFMIAEVYAVDTSRDLCVLRLPEPTTKRNALPINSTVLGSGEHVYAMGYPDYGNAGKDYVTMSTSDMVMTDGIISQQMRMVKNNLGFEAYMHSAPTSFGNSGGPLVNSNGEVVGVNFKMTNVEDSVVTGSLAVISDELQRVLDSYRVDYATAGSQRSASSSNTLLIVIIAIAAAVVVAAVIIIIVIMMKKKKSSGNSGNYNPSTPSSSKGGAVIIGMKGIMANQSFNVNGSIVLGRNSQKCDISFPVDSKGISGVHCQIRQTNGGYEIMDCGSSNGTFLGSGQKLTPNVPVFIPDGTYFYLGSAEQLFQIKY